MMTDADMLPIGGESAFAISERPAAESVESDADMLRLPEEEVVKRFQCSDWRKKTTVFRIATLVYRRLAEHHRETEQRQQDLLLGMSDFALSDFPLNKQESLMHAERLVAVLHPFFNAKMLHHVLQLKTPAVLQQTAVEAATAALQWEILYDASSVLTAAPTLVDALFKHVLPGRYMDLALEILFLLTVHCEATVPKQWLDLLLPAVVNGKGVALKTAQLGVPVLEQMVFEFAASPAVFAPLSGYVEVAVKAVQNTDAKLRLAGYNLLVAISMFRRNVSLQSANFTSQQEQELKNKIQQFELKNPEFRPSPKRLTLTERSQQQQQQRASQAHIKGGDTVYAEETLTSSHALDPLMDYEEVDVMSSLIGLSSTKEMLSKTKWTERREFLVNVRNNLNRNPRLAIRKDKEKEKELRQYLTEMGKVLQFDANVNVVASVIEVMAQIFIGLPKVTVPNARAVLPHLLVKLKDKRTVPIACLALFAILLTMPYEQVSEEICHLFEKSSSFVKLVLVQFAMDLLTTHYSVLITSATVHRLPVADAVRSIISDIVLPALTDKDVEVRSAAAVAFACVCGCVHHMTALLTCAHPPEALFKGFSSPSANPFRSVENYLPSAVTILQTAKSHFSSPSQNTFEGQSFLHLHVMSHMVKLNLQIPSDFFCATVEEIKEQLHALQCSLAAVSAAASNHHNSNINNSIINNATHSAPSERGSQARTAIQVPTGPTGPLLKKNDAHTNSVKSLGKSNTQSNNNLRAIPGKALSKTPSLTSQSNHQQQHQKNNDDMHSVASSIASSAVSTRYRMQTFQRPPHPSHGPPLAPPTNTRLGPSPANGRANVPANGRGPLTTVASRVNTRFNPSPSGTTANVRRNGNANPSPASTVIRTSASPRNSQSATKPQSQSQQQQSLPQSVSRRTNPHSLTGSNNNNNNNNSTKPRSVTNGQQQQQQQPVSARLSGSINRGASVDHDDWEREKTVQLYQSVFQTIPAAPRLYDEVFSEIMEILKKNNCEHLYPDITNLSFETALTLNL